MPVVLEEEEEEEEDADDDRCRHARGRNKEIGSG